MRQDHCNFPRHITPTSGQRIIRMYLNEGKFAICSHDAACKMQRKGGLWLECRGPEEGC
jgi:hypothetical protein